MSARLVLVASLICVGAALPARADILIQVDQSTQRMTVDVDGQPLYDWRVSTGRPGYDTPNGAFRPNRMDADHFSREYDNAPMPHAIFFDLHGHAIHGTYDPVGHPAASHGCVRLDPANATTLFTLVKQEGMGHTKVEISGDVRVALANMRPTRGTRVAGRRPREREEGLGVIYGQTASYSSQPPNPYAQYGAPPNSYPQYDYQPYATGQSYQYPTYNRPDSDSGW
jgi:L,D-transpeptidase catalytic domain